MTKKDKIEALKRQLILHPSYLTIIEEIEKDLEVLECFKKIDKKELWSSLFETQDRTCDSPQRGSHDLLLPQQHGYNQRGLHKRVYLS